MGIYIALLVMALLLSGVYIFKIRANEDGDNGRNFFFLGLNIFTIVLSIIGLVMESGSM